MLSQLLAVVEKGRIRRRHENGVKKAGGGPPFDSLLGDSRASRVQTHTLLVPVQTASGRTQTNPSTRINGYYIYLQVLEPLQQITG